MTPEDSSSYEDWLDQEMDQLRRLSLKRRTTRQSADNAQTPSQTDTNPCEPPKAPREGSPTVAPRPRRLRMKWAIGIDPGAVHVGYAQWTKRGDEKQGQVRTAELTPSVAPQQLDRDLTSWTELGDGTVVIEEFRLYGGHTLGSQVAHKMDTSELIGALKYVCKQHDVDVVEQGASIKAPTRAQLRARGIKLDSLGRGGHATDAETHLYYFLLRRGLC